VKLENSFANQIWSLIRSNICIQKHTKNFRSRRWGSSLTVCARLTVRSSPHQTSGNFPAHMSAESSSNTSPNPSEVISEVLEPLDNFSKYPPFPPKNRIVRGVAGIPEFFFWVGILIFLLLRSPCKISKPYDNPFWEN
jgi:hypothetical protein